MAVWVQAGAQPQMLPAPSATTPAQPAVSDSATRQAPAPDAAGYWASIRNSTNPADFEAFLERYPDHAFASLARARLDSLRGAPAGAQPAPAPATGQRAATPQPAEGPRSLYGTAPVPGGPQPAAQPLSPEQLAVDLQTALKAIKCYTARIDGDWGRGSRAALQRFNALAGTSFAADIPTPEALAAVTSWEGGDCKIVAKRAPRKRTTTTRRRATAPPPRQAPARRGGGIGIIIGGGGVGIGF